MDPTLLYYSLPCIPDSQTGPRLLGIRGIDVISLHTLFETFFGFGGTREHTSTTIPRPHHSHTHITIRSMISEQWQSEGTVQIKAMRV